MGDPTEDLRLERDFLLQLLELGQHDAPGVLLEEALALIVRLSGAEKAYIELYDADRRDADPPQFFAAHGVSGAMIGTIRATLSSTIIRETLARGTTVETASALNDARWEATQSIRTHAIQAVVCTPIRLATGAPLGVVYLQGHSRGLAFPEPAVRLSELFARHLAPVAHRLLAIHAARAPDPTAPWRQKLVGAGRLVGRSPALAKVLRSAALVAPRDQHVLISGPSGSGKTEMARIIAESGPTGSGPHIEANFASLPEAWVESDLFGTLSGSGTAGTERIVGKVEAAEGGTLLLDEVGDLTGPAQAKLLQLLQSRTYFPAGATRPSIANVRIIAVANVDLAERVAAGRFREDLFYRLQAMPIVLPGLDERRSDLPELAEHFCGRTTERLGLPALRVAVATVRGLERADWPGSVRQLEDTLAAAVVRAFADGSATLEPHHVFPDRTRPNGGSPTFHEAVHDFQRRLLRDALMRHDGNVTEAARSLGIGRSHAYSLIRALEVERDG